MKAVFLDRDGVINELIYHEDHGIIDSPFTIAQLHILPGVIEAIRNFHICGYKVIIVSNQPGVAKNHMSMQTFENIRQHLLSKLKRENAAIDTDYYCFHHPQAANPEYRKECDCRKPKHGLLVKASQEQDIELPRSWMIGDGLTDVQAGKKAGCRTILLANMKCELCRYMDKENARPDAICINLLQASEVIKGLNANEVEYN